MFSVFLFSFDASGEDSEEKFLWEKFYVMFERAFLKFSDSAIREYIFLRQEKLMIYFIILKTLGKSF